jgi:hypothetical protein
MSIDDIKDIKVGSLFILLIITTSTLSMGVGLIYVFNEPLFLILSEWKLILLATSITAPCWVLNFIIINLLKAFLKSSKGNIISISLLTSLLNIFFIGIIFVIKSFSSH